MSNPFAGESHEGAGSDARLCLLSVGGQTYALDIMRIEEILQPSPATPIPGAPPFVEGVLRLRGSIVPVVSLRVRLKAGLPRSRGKPKLLLTRVGSRRVALRVDSVLGVVNVPRAELRPIPGVAAPGPSPFVLGVFGPANALTLLLNVKAVLRPDSEAFHDQSAASAEAER